MEKSPFRVANQHDVLVFGLWRVATAPKTSIQWSECISETLTHLKLT